MNGDITYRSAINANKKYIIDYLSKNSGAFTNDIVNNYAGEKEKRAVRVALKELRSEGKITTDDHVYMWQGKYWVLQRSFLT